MLHFSLMHRYGFQGKISGFSHQSCLSNLFTPKKTKGEHQEKSSVLRCDPNSYLTLPLHFVMPTRLHRILPSFSLLSCLRNFNISFKESPVIHQTIFSKTEEEVQSIILFFQLNFNPISPFSRIDTVQLARDLGGNLKRNKIPEWSYMRPEAVKSPCLEILY